MRVDLKAVGKNKDTFKLGGLDDNVKTAVKDDSDSDFMSTIWGKRLPPKSVTGKERRRQKRMTMRTRRKGKTMRTIRVMKKAQRSQAGVAARTRRRRQLQVLAGRRPRHQTRQRLRRESGRSRVLVQTPMHRAK